MPPYQSSPIKAFSESLVLTGLCLIGYVIFAAVGFGLLMAGTGFGFEELQEMSYDPAHIPGSRLMLLLLQGFAALGSFVVFPSLIRFFGQANGGLSKPALMPSLTLLGLVAALSILMMPVNAWLAAWNESVHLPSFLDGFQNWAAQKEQTLESLTLYLVNFQSVGEVVAGYVVIALVAGFSEEFFFRKMLQPRMVTLFKNHHAGIWITAFIFSAIHIQFYGLVPRMVLGALFGYYFYWTGNLWVPVLGHALNNAITLTGMTLYQSKLSPIDVENPNIVPWYIGAVAAGITWSLAVMVKEEADKIAEESTSPPGNKMHIPN